MTGLACLFGIHSPELTRMMEIGDLDGVRRVLTLRRLTSCARCGIRIAEEVIPVAELPASGDRPL